jgi:hypothetical protein
MVTASGADPEAVPSLHSDSGMVTVSGAEVGMSLAAPAQGGPASDGEYRSKCLPAGLFRPRRRQPKVTRP